VPWLAEAEPLVIKLWGSSALKGRVVNDAYVNAKPVAGATVRLVGTNKTAQSDHDGRFWIAPLVGGKKNVGIDISAEGYASGHIDTDLPDEGEAAIEARLCGAATLTGMVTDRVTSKPVAKATVTLQGTQLKAQTGTDGKFTLSSVPPGVQRVCAFANRYGVAEKVTTVTPSANAAIELALFPGNSLRGTVVWGESNDSSAPISAATVSVKGTNVSASTDHSGRFSLEGLPPEKMILVVKALGFRVKEVERDPCTDIGKPIQLIGDSSVAGRVVDATYEPPRPVANATLRIDHSTLVTYSDKDGRFILEGVPSGPAKVNASASGYLPREICQRLQAETANSVGDIALTGNSELEGTITDRRTGAPIANADIRVNGTDLAAKTDAAGHYHFAELSPNPIDVMITVEGYQSVRMSKNIDAGKNVLQVPLQPRVLVVAGNVVNAADKRPVGGVTIEVTPQGKKPISTITDDEGNYRVEDVPAGPATVVAADDSFEAKKIEQDFQADAQHLDFVMSPRVEQGHGPTVGQAIAGSKQNLRIADAGRGSGIAGGAGPGSGGGAGALPGAGPNSGLGPESGGGSSEEPKTKYRQSWMRMPDDKRLEKLVFYLATGENYSAGRVYMVSVWGNKLASVGLVGEGAATGIAFHKGKDGGGLVVAIPRNKGRIMRIGYEGKASTELAAVQGLPHPVDVAIGGNSDETFVVDDIANSLGCFKSGTRDPDLRLQRLLPGFSGQSSTSKDQHVSVAVTNDKHVIAAGETGVYRDPSGLESKPLLPKYGGVAADPLSAVWAAAQPPNLIYVYNGEQLVKKLSLPRGMVHYRNGRLAFSHDDGWLCVACQKENGEADDGIQLYLCYDIEKGQYERLFGWGPKYWAHNEMADIVSDDKEINDFVVGPWLRWPGAPPPSGAKSGKSLRQKMPDDVNTPAPKSKTP
jgi:hypothetical protein